MQGTITKGTTIGGRAVNAGDTVDLNPDEFQKLKLTGDIEPIPETPVEGKKDETESKPATKKKK